MKKIVSSLSVLFLLALCSNSVSAQTTAFTYQGKLVESGGPANGSYLMQFRLFDGGGTQVGTTITDVPVTVTDGIFTTRLDFGVAPFTWADRTLEISVRHNSGEAYTTLSPRQPITSTPYSLRSLSTSTADTATNATNLGGQPASQYVQTNDARLTDARSPTPGSSNYVQNGTTQQVGTNFNISGNGTAGGVLAAGAVDSAGEYRIGGTRVLSLGTALNPNLVIGPEAGAPNGAQDTLIGYRAGKSVNNVGQSVFVGYEAGFNQVSGGLNTFIGAFAGHANDTGTTNTYVGYFAGASNKGSRNNMFGASSGGDMQTGNDNSFFGNLSGRFATSGDRNAEFGAQTGLQNLHGSDNSYFGYNAGGTDQGSGNAFFGVNSGANNQNGTNNTAIGPNTKIGLAGLSNATAIGSNAQVDQSNTIVLGAIAGTNGAAASTNVGIGTTKPLAPLEVDGNSIIGVLHTGDQIPSHRLGIVGGPIWTSAGWQGAIEMQNISAIAWQKNAAGNRFGIGQTNGGLYFFASASDPGTSGSPAVYSMVINDGGNVGINTTAPTQRLSVNGNETLSGFLQLDGPALGGDTPLCRVSGSHQLAFCSSSLRYKKDVAPFTGGLDLLRRLRPISYTWKSSGLKDVGLGAEDVAKIEPRLITYNDQGQVEGVKYDRINMVLINALKEQQTQIDQLRAELDGLKKRMNTRTRKHRR